MVSFHTPLSPTKRKVVPELENLLKKRKRDDDDDHDQADEEVFEKALKAKTSTLDHTQLHLQTPLPLEWQRCLDIKSGQIYYYNTKTNKKTSSDPRLTSQEPTGPTHHMISLDLELNLPCGSHLAKDKFSKQNCSDRSLNSSLRNNNNGGLITRSPSWLNLQGEQQEMVTAVCKNCHMLVMMCKSSPACPNCKFMHPPDHNTPNLFNRRLSLSC